MPVAELDRQRERCQRRDAPETDEPLDDISVRLSRGQVGDRLVEGLSLLGLRVRSFGCSTRRTRSRAAHFGPRCLRSHASWARVHAVASYTAPVTQKQLREPMPSTHQITASVPHEPLTRSRAASSSSPGTRTAVDLAKPQQPRQPLGITDGSVLTRSAAGRIFDGAATTQLIPRIGTRPREPIPGRPRLVDDPNRLPEGSSTTPPSAFRPREGTSLRSHLTAPQIDHARDHRPSMHIKPDTATFVHNRRLPYLRLYRRAHPDGNPRLTYERGAGHSIRSGPKKRPYS